MQASKERGYSFYESEAENASFAATKRGIKREGAAEDTIKQHSEKGITGFRVR